jgi:hypothetical protein
LRVIGWVYAFVDRPRDRFGAAAAFWTAVTGSRLSARRGEDGEFATLVPESGDACVKLQGVQGPAGAHLDLAVEDVAAAVGSAKEAGAGTVAEHGDRTVLCSPAGLEFCVLPWQGEAVRPGIVHKGASASRLDQVCLDVGPAEHARELAFWQALTGWARRKSSPEFDLLYSARQPVRILVQRLDEQRPAGAHLDLACSDRDATRVWHQELGARLVSRHEHWLVMADPAGGTYCLTGRDPAATG